MATGNRRTLLVLVLLAVLCVLLFVTGVLGGGRNVTWTPHAGGGGFPRPATLTRDDLRVVRGDGCRLGPAPMPFTDTCGYVVEKSGGRFSLKGIVRRAKLVVAAGPVAVTTTVEGREITTTLESGKSVGLTIGKEGGQLTLTCQAPLPGCVVGLAEDKP